MADQDQGSTQEIVRPRSPGGESMLPWAPTWSITDTDMRQTCDDPYNKQATKRKLEGIKQMKASSRQLKAVAIKLARPSGFHTCNEERDV